VLKRGPLLKKTSEKITGWWVGSGQWAAGQQGRCLKREKREKLTQHKKPPQQSLNFLSESALDLCTKLLSMKTFVR
jgi:hypothetical protein